MLDTGSAPIGLVVNKSHFTNASGVLTGTSGATSFSVTVGKGLIMLVVKFCICKLRLFTCSTNSVPVVCDSDSGAGSGTTELDIFPPPPLTLMIVLPVVAAQTNVKLSEAEFPALSVTVIVITYVSSALAEIVVSDNTAVTKVMVPDPDVFVQRYDKMPLPESESVEVWVNDEPFDWSAPALTEGAVASQINVNSS